MTDLRLGKRAPLHDERTLQLANYLGAGGALPSIPAWADWFHVVRDYGMMQNDAVGDCTCAAAGHMVQTWTANAGAEIVPKDTDVLAAYSQVSGYNPKTGANDNGAIALDVLNFWRKTGVAGHKIGAYMALEPANKAQVRAAVFLFGGCYIGLNLPLSAQTQTNWSVPPKGTKGKGAPGSWGGHCVNVVGFDAGGLTCITWGAPKYMTWQFWLAYCDEAYAVLSADWLARSSGRSPQGFDLAALQSDLQLLKRAA